MKQNCPITNETKGDFMASADTMELMGESFVSLAEKLPVEKISVSDIVAASGKNRKTFYYHFESKAHLIRWIFRNDLAQTLLNRFDADHLVYEREGESAIADKPYYAFKKVGVRSLDGSEFFQALADTFDLRRTYYAKVLNTSDSDGLRSYLFDLYVPALENDIRFILSNRSLDESGVHFLAEFYAGAAIAYLVRRVSLPAPTEILGDVAPFQNIIHSSLENEIKEQQLRRVL